MPHALPPLGHPLREAFDVADLVRISTGEQPVRTHLHELRCAARNFFSESTAVKRVFFFKVAPNDCLQLVSFGPRGGYRKEWSFGPVTSTTRIV